MVLRLPHPSRFSKGGSAVAILLPTRHLIILHAPKSCEFRNLIRKDNELSSVPSVVAPDTVPPYLLRLSLVWAHGTNAAPCLPKKFPLIRQIRV